MNLFDVYIPSKFLADDLPENPAERTKFFSTTLVPMSGLLYHGWYIVDNDIATADVYFPEAKKDFVLANYPADQTYIHPDIERATTSFINTNTTFLKAPDCPDALEQPAGMPDGAEFKPWMYYVRGNRKHFPQDFYINTTGLTRLRCAQNSTQMRDAHVLMYWPTYAKPPFKVMAVSHQTGTANRFNDLIILDATPRKPVFVGETQVADEGVVLYIQDFFGNDDCVTNLVTVCPGDGSKSAWAVLNTVTLVHKLYELRLTYDTVTGDITPELVELSLAGFPTGDYEEGKDGLPVSGGAQVQNKSPTFNRGAETVNTCSGGGTVTTANNVAAFTAGVDEDSEVTRQYKKGREPDLNYDVVYCKGDLWVLYEMLEQSSSRTRAYTYNVTGNIDEIFNDGACSKTYSGAASWTKTRTDTYTSQQKHTFKAVTFSGEINLATITRTYSGTYKYEDKWNATNSLTATELSPNPNKYNHEDDISESLTGLFGSYSYSDSGTYVGSAAPDLNPDLVGCPYPPSDLFGGLSLIGPGPLNNFDYQPSHLVEISEVILKSREVWEQGLHRTSTELPDATLIEVHSQYSYVLTSGTLNPLATGTPTPPLANAYLDGHEGNYDYYPFWSEDQQEIKHRYLRSFPPFDSDVGVPNQADAIWL